MKKLLVLLLSLCFAVALFAGCQPTNSADPTTAAPTSGAPENTVAPEKTPEPLAVVNLTWYVIGDKGKDHDKIMGLLNDMTVKDPKIMATCETKFWAWGDWQTQLPLTYASGENFDMTFTANWAQYGQQASKGAFYELTEENLSTYAPDAWENIPPEAWKQTLVDGKMYMIPNTQDEYSTQTALALRGDFMKEFEMTEIDSIAEWEAYLAKVKEKHPEIIPYDEGNSWSTPLGIFYTQLYGLYGAQTLPHGTQDLSKEDGGGKISMPGRDDKDRYVKALAKSREFLEKGYWSKTALSNTVRTQDLFVAGKSATATSNIGTMNLVYQNTMAPDKGNPSWNPYLVNLIAECPYAVRTSFLGNGFAVNKNAANPERALMWINGVKYTQEYADLLMYGIEGDHWLLQEDGTRKSGPKAADITSWSWWGVVSWESIRQSADNSPQFADIMSYLGGKLSKCISIYMNVSTAGIENEIAALTQLRDKYEKDLNLGNYPNYEAKLAEYVTALEAAGWQKCADSYADQITKYMAANK